MDFSQMDEKSLFMLLQLLQIKNRMETEQRQNQNQESDENNDKCNSKYLIDVITQT